MSTPYELRFQIFETAKQTLVDEYWAQKEKRDSLIEVVPTMDQVPEYPEYPSMQDVMNRAKIINEFVSKS